jgi:glycyl-tRNA synthetase alpha subunit
MNNPLIPAEVQERMETEMLERLPAYLQDGRDKGRFAWEQGYKTGATTEYILAQQELEVSRDMLDRANGEIRELVERMEAMRKKMQEERDVFAMSFLVFALFDPRAQALINARSPAGAILALYKDRPSLDPDTSNQ